MYHQPFVHVAKLKEVVYHIFSQLPSEYVCKSEAISPLLGWTYCWSWFTVISRERWMIHAFV